MFKKIVLFTVFTVAIPGIGHAATCSVINLNRCLDSVCAIGVSTNPAARCQYCGNAGAGTPPASKMRSVSAGQSSKNTLTEKELKDAPTDPGARYAWAKAECFKKIADCTNDDTEKYDEMIQQSCDVAGVVAQKDVLTANATKSTATQSSCANTMTVCMLADTRCGPDWSACATDTDFDTFFAACGVDATGCDEFTADIRTQLSASRKSYIDGAADRIASIAKSYQTARQDKLTAARDTCENNASMNTCIKARCNNNMPNKCTGEFQDAETAAATKLCKFYELACNAVKNIKQ